MSYSRTIPGIGVASVSIVEFAKPNAAQSPSALHFPLAVVALQTSAHHQIEALSKLEENWDGYGGLPTTRESRVYARRFLAHASPAILNPEITPSSNGTIGLEWQSNHGEAYLEIGRTRYSGHIQPKHGGTIYIEGQSAFLGQDEAAVIQQLLYAASGSKSPTNSSQITQPTF